MRRKSIVFALIACLGFGSMLTGCSFEKAVDDAMDAVIGEENQTTQETSTGEMKEAKVVDDSLESPAFAADLAGSILIVQDSPCAIDGSASVQDGGEVTYQWYVNNVNSNGGGTVIPGATEAVLEPDISEAGFKYYYVVASNNHDDHVKMSTSNCREIHVLPRGGWCPDENGANKYVLPDGSYPTETWLELDGETYYIDFMGNRLTGWATLWDIDFYFSETGEVQRNTTTPDGFQTGPSGEKIG